MMTLYDKLKNFLRKDIASRLAIIITAAIFLELMSVVQYYYTRHLLKEELDKRSEIELAVKKRIIQNTLQSAEETMEDHLWDMQTNLSNPDSMFSATRRLIATNEEVVGGCIAFKPHYYPSKGRLFEPYAYKKSNGQIDVVQLGSQEHDYTKHPAYQSVVKNLKSVWSDPYLYGTDSIQRLSTYSYPLYDKKGQFVAVCGTDIDLTWLGDTLNAWHGYPSSFGLMLTSSGHLVSGSSQQNSRQQDIEQVVRLINDSTVKRTWDKNHRNQMIEFRTQKDGEKAYIYYSALTNQPNWQIALVSYDREVYAKVYRMRSYSMLMMLTGLLVLFFLINRFARSERRLHKAGVEQARIGSELHIARNIQTEMLPKTFPPYPDRDDIDIYGTLSPAKEVGGDLFDFFIRDEKLFFCIGDVSGKGVPSAIVMAVMHSLYRMIKSHVNNPASIMQSLNEELCKDNETNMFVTLFIGIIDLPTGHLYYCNAGHDNPILVGSMLEKLPLKANLPIGVFDDTRFEMQDLQLPADVTLFLYTDGLTEAKNAEHKQFGMRRVMEALAICRQQSDMTAEMMVNTVNHHVQQFTNWAPQSDDLTLLAIHYRQQKEDNLFSETLTLANDVSEITRLNMFVKQVTSQINMDKKTARYIQLALEEVVTNVINYAYPAGTKGNVTIEAKADKHDLRFVVSDNGQPFNPTEAPLADTSLSAEDRPIGGLGILLIRKLVDTVNYERIDEKNILTLRKHLS